LQSASASLSVQADESGWNPSRDGAQRFTLRSPAAANPEQVPRQEGAFILLVEDNPADAGLIRAALQEHGVEGEILIIADGEKAVQFIQAIDSRSLECPDLVIIDVNLPKRPGREVLELLRLSEKCRLLPVIVLSSSDAAQDKADAARFGATRYLKKPLHLQEFLNLGAIFKDALRGGAG
jgi:CheY-like chemotaxis protein